MIYMLNANARYIPLADRSVQMIATSPPYYGLRSYHTDPQIWPNGTKPCAAGEHEWGDEVLRREADGFRRMKWNTGGDPAVKREYQQPSQGCLCHRCGAWRGELGLEPSPDLYVAHIVEIARELWRVLKDDGVFWLNLGDSYASGKSGRDDSGDNGKFGGPRIEPIQRHAPSGFKSKDLCMIPARVAIALQADGWWLRSEIIWHKPNPMPESVTDRPTRAHEMIYLLTKSAQYFYDAEAIKEPIQESSIKRAKYGWSGKMIFDDNGGGNI